MQIIKNDILNRNRAFTLAEVLVTLVVIGVIAAMTIPVIIQYIDDAQFKAGWKKVYSQLAQATSAMVMDNSGSLVNSCTSDYENCLNNMYTARFKTSKICTNGSLSGNCWHNSGSWYQLSGEGISWGNTAGFIDNAGVLYRVEAAGFPLCDNSSWVSSIPKCAFINVDVNGFKKPNTIGRDIFLAIVTENRILPVGTADDSAHSNDCQKGQNGWGCSAKFLSD